MGIAPRKIDVYVFWELAKGAVIGSLIAVVVLLCLQILRLSEMIIKSGLEKEAIFRMLGHLGLSFTPLVVPIACLFAMLAVFGRMSGDREFIAAQSLGLSPSRLLRTSVGFGVISCLASLAFAFQLGPAGNRGFEATIDEAFKRKVASALNSGTFNEGFLDMVLFVDKVNPVNQELERVFLNDATNFREELSVSARRGHWIQPTEVDSVGVLKLSDGVAVSRDIERNTVRRVKFDEYRIYADFSSQAGRPKDSPPSLSWAALMKRRTSGPATADRRQVWIELARRFAVSVSCLLFVPITFALSFDNRRTAKGRAVMTGLILLFAYWTVYFSIMTWIVESRSVFIQSNEWFTWLMIWVPNMILAAVGAYAFAKKRSGMSH